MEALYYLVLVGSLFLGGLEGLELSTFDAIQFVVTSKFARVDVESKSYLDVQT
jgi:hypothetical protein